VTKVTIPLYNLGLSTKKMNIYIMPICPYIVTGTGYEVSNMWIYHFREGKTSDMGIWLIYYNDDDYYYY
jgi:hypothetical protein